MRKLSDLARVVEAIVYAPTYILLGVDYKGRVVYQTMEGGFNSIWVLDEKSNERKRLSTTTIHWSSNVSSDRRRAPFTRDIAGGKELQVVGFVDLERDEEVLYEDMVPVRVLGLADDEGKLFFAGATAEDIALYVAKGSVEKLYRLNTYARVTHAQRGIVVGEGHLKKNPRSSEIFVYNYQEGSFKVYTPKEGSVNKNPVVLSNNKVLFETNAVTGDTGTLMLLDPETNEFTELKLPRKDLEEFKPAEYVFYREFEKKIIVVGKKNGRSRLFIDGALVETPVGSVLNAHLVGEKIYYTHTSLIKPTRVMVYENGLSREVVGAKLPSEIEESFGDVEFTWIRAPDGVEVPTYVVKSRSKDKRKAFVVYVHGGPWWETADEWNVRAAVLVAAGYNVIAPNFRGSTGYGEKFRLMDIGDPGGGDLLDVEATTKWALERGLGEKAFIWGYSYGGYMTLWATFSKPELYECGVAGAPVADWEEMYDLSDAVFREFINILFDNRRDLWKERSPSTRVANLKAQLAIIQPQNDSRTPLKPVLNLVYKLMDHGKAFEFHVIPDIGHAITKPDKLAEVLFHMLSFFEKCVERKY